MGLVDYLEENLDPDFGGDGKGERFPIDPPSYRCPICKWLAPNADALPRHILNEHPTDRPVLLIDHISARSTKQVIRSLESIESIQLVNCTRIKAQIDNQSRSVVNPDQLINCLNSLKNSRIVLDLINFRQEDERETVAKYSFEIRIDDEKDLSNIDSELAKLLEYWPDFREIQSGLTKLSGSFETGSDYIASLHGYLLAIHLRDGNQVIGRDYEDYPNLLMRSYQVLRTFDRPIANLVSNYCRLILNWFQADFHPSNHPRLDTAFIFFQEVSTMIDAPPQPHPATINSFANMIPIDRVTEQILMMATEKSLSLSHQIEDITESQSLNDGTRLDQPDLCKFLVLAISNDFDRSQQNKEHLLQLSDTREFGKWAKAHMKPYGSKDAFNEK